METSQVTTDSNMTSSEESTQQIILLPLQIACDCLRVAFGALALAANGLMIAAFTRYPSLRTKTNTLLINLCITDSLAGICNLNVPLVHYAVADNDIILKLHQFLFVLTSFGEVTALLLIGVERYLHIVHPVKYSNRVTTKRLLKVISVSWVVLLLIAVNITLKAPKSIYEFFEHSVNAVLVALVIWLQVLMLSILYLAVYWHARKHLNTHVHPHGIPINMSYRYRLFKMTAIIFSVYAVSNGPALLSGTLVAAKLIHPADYVKYCFDINRVFYALQTWINPIIYAWKNKQIKIAFRKLLHLQTSSSASMNVPNIALNHLN